MLTLVLNKQVTKQDFKLLQVFSFKVFSETLEISFLKPIANISKHPTKPGYKNETNRDLIVLPPSSELWFICMVLN